MGNRVNPDAPDDHVVRVFSLDSYVVYAWPRLNDSLLILRMLDLFYIFGRYVPSRKEG